MKKLLLSALVVFLTVMSVSAFDTSPFQLGIWAPKFQVVPEEINVSGLRINLPYGGNNSVTGLDLGLAGSSNYASALQVNLIFNRAQEEFAGLQASLFNQAGCASGVSLGGFNITDDKTRGIQIGLINSSMETHGIQIGAINYTEHMTGVQIGIVNIITQSVIPFFPIINLCF